MPAQPNHKRWRYRI